MNASLTAGRALLLGAWLTNGYKVALLRPGYQPWPSDSAATVLAYEVSGAGYAAGYGGAGRKTLTGKTVTVDAAHDRVLLDANDLTWAGLNVGQVGALAIVLEAGGGDATSTVLAVLELPVQTTDGSAYTVEWPPSGILVF